MTGSGSRPNDPEGLLAELGIQRPQDIDVEIISEYCGATVVYEPLTSCEARVIGVKDRAVITVNSKSVRRRQRFSAAHELGHWIHDRGHLAQICQERWLSSAWTGSSRETRANLFAADLLLPRSMFVPAAKGLEITFKSIEMLAEVFQSSLTATAIRLVRHGSFPAMVVCSSSKGREWFVSSSEIERRLWPFRKLSKEAIAYRLLSGEKVSDEPVDVDADAWIESDNAGDFVVREHSRKITAELVLTLLWWKDQSQITALDD